MKLCVVAGEASGDIHASEVVRELRAIDPGLSGFGFGGDHLRAEGVDILHDIRELAVVGLFNVIRHLPMFRRVFDDIAHRIESERPDAVLLVDFPDFNLRLAKRCRALGVPVIYYISPQIWAWRRRRVHEIARNVDRMIVIFPFEESFYRDHGVSVAYVGHPLVEQLAGVRRTRPVPPPEPVRIALLPGSRRMEVASLLPPMLDAIAELRKDRAVDAYIVKAPTIDRARLDEIVAAHRADVRIVEEDGRLALADADLSLCSSGTATLESAVVGVPVIVMYRLGRMTYALAKRLVKIPHFSLVNIVAGKRIVPELLQDEVNGTTIARTAREVLAPDVYATTLDGLAEVRRRLGEPGAAKRAAVEIASFVGSFHERSRGGR
ncbi:MAG: lipid-A-disaccharide synthase [Thermoanaerobaculia bacterium]